MPLRFHHARKLATLVLAAGVGVGAFVSQKSPDHTITLVELQQAQGAGLDSLLEDFSFDDPRSLATFADALTSEREELASAAARRLRAEVKRLDAQSAAETELTIALITRELRLRGTFPAPSSEAVADCASQFLLRNANASSPHRAAIVNDCVEILSRIHTEHDRAKNVAELPRLASDDGPPRVQRWSRTAAGERYALADEPFSAPALPVQTPEAKQLAGAPSQNKLRDATTAATNLRPSGGVESSTMALREQEALNKREAAGRESFDRSPPLRPVETLAAPIRNRLR